MKKLAELLKDFTVDDTNKCMAIAGIPFLDEVVSTAFQSGKLIVIGSVKRGGKTLLASQTAMNLAEFEGKSILYYSLKESSQLMFKRFFAQKYHIKQVLGREPLDENEPMFGWACSDIKKLAIHIEDNTPISIEELETSIWQFAQKIENGFIVIDSLQDLGTINHNKKLQWQEWGDIAIKLKQSAVENQVCIILTCQFESNPVPGIQNIVGGRGIDQAADLIIQLHNPAQYEDDIPADSQFTEIHVLKNRGGAETIVNVHTHQDVLLYIPAF